MRLVIPLLALTLAFSPTPISAQDTKAGEVKQEQKKEEPKKDPKIEEYEKAIKDLKRLDGQFAMYQRKKEILLELPEKDLGRVFLIQATFNTGSGTNMTQAGDPVGPFETQPFRWEKRDENIWIVRPNLRYRWSAQDPCAIAAQRSFPEAVLGSFRIEATNPEKKLYLVNITQLFYGEYLRLSEVLSSGLGGQFMLDREKSGPARIGSFPENALVRMDLYYMSPRGIEPNPFMALLGITSPSQLEDDRSLPVSVTFNFWYRKDTGYMPRIADPRVGYFTQDFYSVDKFLDEDRTERYINRFDLKKKDPAAIASEPVKPIVWYLDPSVPKDYRQAVRDGILRWNAAFEKIGLKNAIVVRDAPENDPNWDHADGRFNVLRWTMSPDAGYAIALARTDPFTGEVLNASVTVDANMLAFAQQEQQGLGVPATEALARTTSVLTRGSVPTGATAERLLYGDRREEAGQSALAKMGWTYAQCRYGEGMKASASVAWSALEASGLAGIAITREDYARAFLRDVVSHEIGHTLGLRHNFVSSTFLTTAQLADDSLTSQESISASVMDYTPVNILAILKGRGNFYAPTIGRYDFWAIQYGYTPVAASTPGGERYKIGAIAAKSGQPGLGYMTDENADSWNPYAVRFDSSKNPIEYSRKMLEAARRIRMYAIAKLPRKGESYAKRNQLIQRSINLSFREGRYAARFIGGLSASRSYYDGKPQRTLTPVEPAAQRDALRLIVRECLTSDSVKLPANVLENFGADPNSPAAPSWTAPLRDLVGAQQTLLIGMLLSASTTDRIVENQIKWGSRKDAYTIQEHYGAVVGAAFQELGSPDAEIAPLRRDLQRVVIGALMTQAGAPQGAISDDVRVVAAGHLKTLSAKMASRLKKPAGSDRMTIAHLADSKDTIDRFLARRFAVSR